MAKPAKYVLLNGRKYREGSRAHVLEVARSAAVGKQQEKKRQPTIADLQGQITDLRHAKSHFIDEWRKERNRADRLQALLDAAAAALVRQALTPDEIPF